MSLLAELNPTSFDKVMSVVLIAMTSLGGVCLMINDHCRWRKSRLSSDCTDV